MSIQTAFRLHREKVIPLVADPDPRVTPPTDAELFVMNNQLSGSGNSNKDVAGHQLCVRFLDAGNVDVVGPTADFTVWVRDEGTGLFVSTVGVAASPSARRVVSDLVGRLWVQVTAVGAVGASTKLRIMIAEKAPA
jgi:hypothetical protein